MKSEHVIVAALLVFFGISCSPSVGEPSMTDLPTSFIGTDSPIPTSILTKVNPSKTPMKETPPSPSPTTGLAANILSTDVFYGLLTWDNMAFFNNCWGSGYIQHKELVSCSIFYDPSASLSHWQWSWPQEAVAELKGYPTLFIGDKVNAPAGYDRSTDPRFPLHLPSMKSLWAEGDLQVAATGDFDFAFDLAFLEGNISTPKAVRSEIMIWLAASKDCPARKESEYNIDGSAYSLCMNTDWNPGVTYMAFVLEGESKPQRLPIHEFIKIAIQKGYVDPDAYLAAVELGPEIWWGEGEASMRDYRILLKVD